MYHILKYICCYLKVTRAKVTPLTNYIIGSESQIIVTVLHPWRVYWLFWTMLCSFLREVDNDSSMIMIWTVF